MSRDRLIGRCRRVLGRLAEPSSAAGLAALLALLVPDLAREAPAIVELALTALQRTEERTCARPLASSLLEVFRQGLTADAFQPAAVGVRDRPLCELADLEWHNAIVVLVGMSDSEQRVARIAAAYKLPGRIVPRLSGGQDQLAVQANVEPIDMKPAAVPLLDVRAEGQGQMTVSIICDTRILRRRPGHPGPIHRGRRLSRVPNSTHPHRAARFGLSATWRAAAHIRPFGREGLITLSACRGHDGGSSLSRQAFAGVALAGGAGASRARHAAAVRSARAGSPVKPVSRRTPAIPSMSSGRTSGGTLTKRCASAERAAAIGGTEGSGVGLCGLAAGTGGRSILKPTSSPTKPSRAARGSGRSARNRARATGPRWPLRR